MRTILWALAFVCAVALAQPAGQGAKVPAGQAARRWTQPKTTWGDPDLEGVWTSDNNFSIPLERPAEVADKVVLEGTELQEALARRAKTIAAVETGGEVGAGPSHWYENLTARSARSSLIIDPPNGRLPVSIMQAPGYVVIAHEMIHDARIVPMDGRPHLSPTIRQYMGDSRGRWDGNTLVIDVTNFHPAITTYHPTASFRGHGATLHLIERYTRTARDEMRYEVTVDDPGTFERPYTAVLDLKPQGNIFEYACHEGNRGLANILSAARAEEKR